MENSLKTRGKLELKSKKKLRLWHDRIEIKFTCSNHVEIKEMKMLVFVLNILPRKVIWHSERKKKY